MLPPYWPVSARGATQRLGKAPSHPGKIRREAESRRSHQHEARGLGEPLHRQDRGHSYSSDNVSLCGQTTANVRGRVYLRTSQPRAFSLLTTPRWIGRREHPRKSSVVSAAHSPSRSGSAVRPVQNARSSVVSATHSPSRSDSSVTRRQLVRNSVANAAQSPINAHAACGGPRGGLFAEKFVCVDHNSGGTWNHLNEKTPDWLHHKYID